MQSVKVGQRMVVEKRDEGLEVFGFFDTEAKSVQSWGRGEGIEDRAEVPSAECLHVYTLLRNLDQAKFEKRGTGS